VWISPEILTWEAWLARQWRDAQLAARIPDTRQLLAPAQERLLWEQVLQQLAPAGDPELLRPHAAALMRSAARATQSRLALARSAMTEEESLLATALRAVRSLCADRGLLSLSLAPAEDLGFLAQCLPPAIAGQPRLTELQQRLQDLCWPEAELLLAPADGRVATPSLRAAGHLEAEIAACARWCREMLQQDGAYRLLVVSAWSDPGAHTQGALLWREFAGDAAATATDDQRRTLLAVEGGEPLHHQALVADALAALACLGEWIDTPVMLRLLRSPYFDFGSAAEACALQVALGAWGLARWSSAALGEALASQADKLPAAGRLQRWLDEARRLLRESPQRSATRWAEKFSECLRLAGFAAATALESRDAQRLARWGELLDEFAGLDAVGTPLPSSAALTALQQLALQTTHQSATGDAAITLTTQMQDPLVRYDGIWVMGMTENRWPEPPRPDPYIALSEQRRCQWPEAGVTQRLQAARWQQGRWQACTDRLTLSYALQEGDVRHRPSAAVAAAAETWVQGVAAPVDQAQPLAAQAEDPGLPSIAASDRSEPLRGGLARLSAQQECAFRAQAQFRLGAEQAVLLTDGIPSRLRGILLHSLLEGIWRELRDHERLLQVTPTEQADLIAKHWQAAVLANAAAGVAWLAPQVQQRERARAARLMERVLELDRQRAPFTVLECERETLWNAGGASLRVRIDRIDDTAGGRLLIDYKSGAAESIRLQEGELRPLQLAAYVAALADAVTPVSAAVLLSLKPADLKYAGAATNTQMLPGRIQAVADWPAAEGQWRIALARLMQEHIDGGIELAASLDACRHCHLPALCRRVVATEPAEAVESGDE
ncbi:MAG: PD-(D/E)XK nuclease family protein, partial [Steroidobacteraceae bacterium]